MPEEGYQATFDLLAIVSRLEGVLCGVTDGEVHLLSYLSCLLAVYRGYPASDWGYPFVRSSWGAPYSPDIQERLVEARARGLLEGQETNRVTTEGRLLHEFLEIRVQHAWRVPCHEGSTASALAIPSGVIRNALRMEPSLRSTEVHVGARQLLEGGSVGLLHEHFQALSEAIGQSVEDLMIPSVVWIRYLMSVRRAEDEAFSAEGSRLGLSEKPPFAAKGS